ncbi:MAG: hypothetical protein IH830_08320 [Planctomycetes bacterium]|nr:hypothetical protein [Planctomycetota bacterium]
MTPASDTPARHAARLPIRLGAAILIAVILFLLLSGSDETHSVSHVIREIHKIVLAKPQGGSIGPWWVSAAGLDPLTGELKALKLEFRSVHIAAKTAKVVVNPETDTFQFEMRDVVIARVTETEQADAEHALLDLDRYSFGPMRWSVDIVPDKDTMRLRALPPLRADRLQKED